MSLCGEIENIEHEMQELFKLYLKAHEVLMKRLVKLKQVEGQAFVVSQLEENKDERSY